MSKSRHPVELEQPTPAAKPQELTLEQAEAAQGGILGPAAQGGVIGPPAFPGTVSPESYTKLGPPTSGKKSPVGIMGPED